MSEVSQTPFGTLAVGTKFKLLNVVTGTVLPECPEREKIEPFEFKTGKMMNAQYVSRGRTFYEYFKAFEGVVLT